MDVRLLFAYCQTPQAHLAHLARLGHLSSSEPPSGETTVMASSGQSGRHSGNGHPDEEGFRQHRGYLVAHADELRPCPENPSAITPELGRARDIEKAAAVRSFAQPHGAPPDTGLTMASWQHTVLFSGLTPPTASTKPPGRTIPRAAWAEECVKSLKR